MATKFRQKISNLNFQGATGVAMATKVRQK